MKFNPSNYNAGTLMKYNPIFETSPLFLFLCASFYTSALLLFRGNFAISYFFIFIFFGYLITLCLHEYAHAVVAYLGGDRSVLGRKYLSLNPFRYADPLLSFAIPMVSMAVGGLGLPGGSVQINSSSLRGRLWDSVTSAAGPLSDLLVFLIIAYAIKNNLFFGSSIQFSYALSLLAFLLMTSVIINMLPIPGFDGFGIIEPWLGESASELGLPPEKWSSLMYGL